MNGTAISFRPGRHSMPPGLTSGLVKWKSRVWSAQYVPFPGGPSGAKSRGVSPGRSRTRSNTFRQTRKDEVSVLCFPNGANLAIHIEVPNPVM